MTAAERGRRGPDDAGSPPDKSGAHQKGSNPDGATPAELPTQTPSVAPDRAKTKAPPAKGAE